MGGGTLVEVQRISKDEKWLVHITYLSPEMSGRQGSRTFDHVDPGE